MLLGHAYSRGRMAIFSTKLYLQSKAQVGTYIAIFIQKIRSSIYNIILYASVSGESDSLV
jgi:hypothetical protein